MRTLSKKNKIALIVTLVVLLVVILLLRPFMNDAPIMNDAPKGMRQVESYNANGVCDAINNPECGYCPGEVKEDKCYVRQGELEQYP